MTFFAINGINIIIKRFDIKNGVFFADCCERKVGYKRNK